MICKYASDGGKKVTTPGGVNAPYPGNMVRRHWFWSCVRMLLHNFAAIAFSMISLSLSAESFAIREDGKTSWYNERIEATQNGGESDMYSIYVPTGKKAHVSVYVSNVSSANISSKTITVSWNGGSSYTLSGKGSSSSNSFTSDCSVRIGVACWPGTYQGITGYVTAGTSYTGYYQVPVYGEITYKAYQCAVTYDITVTYESILPDLTIASYSLSGAEAAVDETVSLEYGIKNTGGTSAAASTSYVYDGSACVGMIDVESLAAGAITYGSFQMPQLAVGRHTIKLVADALGSVTEISEGNNESSATVLIYERVPYQVVFDANGGYGTMPNQRFVCGTGQALASNCFVRSGYVFAGWATEPAGSVVYQDESVQKFISFTKDDVVTLYAVWAERMYDVTFDANGGVVDAVKKAYSTVRPCGSLPVASMEGSSFVGWFTELQGGVQITGETYIINDCTLYAHYEHLPYTIAFDANGGIGTMSSIIAYGGKATVLPQCSFSKPGCYFAGWGLSAAPMVVAYDDGADFCGSSETVLVAVWREETTTRYTFDAGGGVGTMQDIVVRNSTSIDLPPCAFKKDGYIFWGWKTELLDGVCTCTAEWKRAVEFDADSRGGIQFAWSGASKWSADTFDSIDGLSTVLNVRMSANDIHAIPAESDLYVKFPAKEGRWYYRFQWNYVEGSSLAYPVEFQYPYLGYTQTKKGSSGDWSWNKAEARAEDCECQNGASPSVPLCLKTNSGSFARDFQIGMRLDPGYFVQTRYALSHSNVETNILISAEENWTAETSADWLTIVADRLDGRRAIIRLTDNNSVDPRTAEINCGAYTITVDQDAGIPTAVLTLDAQGGDVAETILRKVVGEPVGALPTPVKIGYVFNGWWTQRQGGAKISSATVMQNGMQIFAHWNNTVFDVTFDSNGGTCDTQTRRVAYGASLGSLPTPSCVGSVFKGWSVARNGGVFVLPSAKIHSSLTLYAIWEAMVHTVAFDAAEGTGGTSREVKYNDCVGVLPIPQRSGYTFAGWFTSASGGTKISESTIVTGDVTYYAHWTSKVKSYTVQFHKYDGSGATAEQTFKVGETKSLLWMDSQLHWMRDGYEFVGWVPWNPDSKPRVCKYVNGQKVKDLAKEGETVHLWCGWKSSSSYRVCFNKNDGSGNKLNQVILRNKEDTLAWLDSQLEWTRPGYTFQGWAETATGAVKYANGAKVKNLAMNGGTKNLYAIWAGKKYTVQYHKYDGSGATKEQTMTMGKAQRLLWMDSQLGWMRDGYEFVGWVPWNPDSKARVCRYVNGESVKDIAVSGGVFSETVHLWCGWKSSSSYRVCFNKNDGSGTKLNQVILRNKEANLAWLDSLLEWTREGYSFQGWAETASGAVKYANGAKVKNLAMNGGTKNLYAIWKATKSVAKYAAADDGAEVCGAADCGVCLVPDGVPVIEGELADGSGVFCLVMGEDGAVLYLGDGEGWAEEKCEAAPDGDEVVITIAGEVAYRIIFTDTVPLLL